MSRAVVLFVLVGLLVLLGVVGTVSYMLARG
jgi:hypothetical protein